MKITPTMSNEISYSFIVHDVSVTVNASDIKNELMQRYNGVLSVVRLFYKKREEADQSQFTSSSEGPMTRVQVDFAESEDAQRILRDGQINLGGFSRSVHTVRKPHSRYFYPKKSTERPTVKPIKQSLTEQDLINMFAEQRR